MAGYSDVLRSEAASRLRAVAQGREDRRLRAVWRVLLAVPLLLLAGAVARAVVSALGLSGMLPTGLAQAGAFAALLVVWARFVDRRRLAAYGLSVSRSWALDAGIAFAAVVAAQAAWYGLGASLGWADVAVTMSAPDGSLALGLATVFVALAVNVWVQDTVFFGVALRNAAEGLCARGLSPRRAVLGGWLAGILFVVGVHSGSLQRPGLVVAGAVFGALYVHTGELALPVGFHLGVNFTGGWLFAPAAAAGERATVFAVTDTLPAFGAVSGPAIPQMALAYLAVVAWLRWRRGSVGVVPDIARWTGR